MVSDARVLGTRLTVPAVARPDYPGDIAAKRRELICRSGQDRSHAGQYSFDLVVFSVNFETSSNSRGFPFALDERQSKLSLN